MTPDVLHIWGFDTPNVEAKAAVYEGELADIANGVVAAIRHHGHAVKTSTVRGLDGWLVEVRAVVTVDGTDQWHVFTKASDQWPHISGTTR